MKMRERRWSSFCIVVGGLLLLAALGLSACNGWENAQAGEAAQTVVQELRQQTSSELPAETVQPEKTSLDPELPVAEIEGRWYVGELSIPALGLELPVQSEWSYPNLKQTPCRVRGSSRTEDLVLAAHNYASHFGRLNTLAEGDAIFFTDMDGIENRYTVQKVEVHPPTDVEAVEQSGFPLVLYTCTYGGRTRVVVYCIRA